jgi:hypothetical protein
VHAEPVFAWMHVGDAVDGRQTAQAGEAHESVGDVQTIHHVLAEAAALEKLDTGAAEGAEAEAPAEDDVDVDDAVAAVVAEAHFGVAMKCYTASGGYIAEEESGLVSVQQVVVVAADMLEDMNDEVAMSAEEADGNGMDDGMDALHDLEVQMTRAVDVDTGVHEGQEAEAEDMMYMVLPD